MSAKGTSHRKTMAIRKKGRIRKSHGLSPLVWAKSIWNKAKTPANVQAHSRKVAAVSRFIGQKAAKKGFKVDMGLLERCALVHDAEKIEAMQKNEREKTLLSKVLKAKPEIVEIVSQTDLPFILQNVAFVGIESMILFYSDKRVKHTKVVPLKARLSDLLKRYPQYVDEIRAASPLALDLEAALVRQFSFPKNLSGLK